MNDDVEMPCPFCESLSTREIVYGFPSREMVEGVERGELVLGGCLVGEDSPRWECNQCNELFGRIGPMEGGT